MTHEDAAAAANGQRAARDSAFSWILRSPYSYDENDPTSLAIHGDDSRAGDGGALRAGTAVMRRCATAPRRRFVQTPRRRRRQRRDEAASASAIAAALDESPIVFTDYQSQTFRLIRRRFGVNADGYYASFRSTAKERFTAGGSSDAFFFYSGCERFIVKSTTVAEFRELLALAPRYAAYMCEPRHADTFLVRIYGAHTLKMYHNKFYFLVM